MSQTNNQGAERQRSLSGALLPFSGPSRPLLLASASPRRRELLAYLGVPFESIATAGEDDERPPPAAIVAALPVCAVPLPTHPTLLAWRKANAACMEAPDSVIIAADTIVVLGSEVLGKPRNAEHARAMLRQLSGREHTVYTGLAVLTPQPRQPIPSPEHLSLDLVASTVQVAELTDAEIDGYVATGEPMDKAGSYGIQGLGGRLVRSVAGSYTCVVGLPLVSTHRLLAAAGYLQLADPGYAYLRWLEAQGKEPLPCPPTFP